MPSSTSNSEFPQHRAPHAPTRLVWPLSLALAALAVGGVEAAWRSLDRRPTVTDSPALWSHHRSRLGGDKRDVACIGTSRMMCGFATTVFRRRYPSHNLRQLAVPAFDAVAVLRDLARDPDFHGLVLCEIQANGLCRKNWRGQQGHVDYYHKRYTLADYIACVGCATLQERLVARNPSMGLGALVHTSLAERRLPKRRYQVMLSDRWRRDDYGLYDDVTQRRREQFIETSRRIAHAPRPAPDEWLEHVAGVDQFITRIERRGGRVVLVRFPTSGEKWAYDEQAFPKTEYWDLLDDHTHADTIHFLDYPRLARCACVDTSHLDWRTAREFTAALLDILERKGVLPDS